MKLTLISASPLSLMNRACAVCTGKAAASWSTVEGALKSGHESIAEHVNFTFLIEGISRACSHQLVRYRHCSFSQLSQRYTKLGTMEEAVKAAWIIDQETDEILKKYFTVVPDNRDGKLCLANTFKHYHTCIAAGMNPEDARALLPNCTKTNILVTLNLRELMHICNERLCLRAQSEIREVVLEMKKLVEQKEGYGVLSQFLVPKCEKYGKCFEIHSCGRF